MHPINKIKTFIVSQPNTAFAVVGFLFGIMIAFEYPASIPRIINPMVSSVALDEMESKLNSDQAILKEQQKTIDSELTNLQTNLKTKQSGIASLVNDVESFKDKAGWTAKSGEGIEIVLDDTDKDDENANAIAHASDLRDLTDYLWSRGASAISIEAAGGVEERVIFPTSIDCIVNTVLINTTKASPPFKIKALGNRNALSAAINDRSALKSMYERTEKEGLIFYLTDEPQINIPKYSGNLTLDNAQLL